MCNRESSLWIHICIVCPEFRYTIWCCPRVALFWALENTFYREHSLHLMLPALSWALNRSISIIGLFWHCTGSLLAYQHSSFVYAVDECEWVSECVCIFTCVYLHVCVCVCVCVYMCVCVVGGWVCVGVCVWTCIWTELTPARPPSPPPPPPPRANNLQGTGVWRELWDSVPSVSSP
jgi:hypothetical protein